VVDVGDLPCFIIVDKKELLIAMGRNDGEKNSEDKKATKPVALWTNYFGFVETLLTLFSKLSQAGCGSVKSMRDSPFM
jgi:hypothetical protein